MSSTRERKLYITDESNDVLSVQTEAFDDGVDWTDDTEAILASIRIASDKHVNLVRADVRELRDFLSEILSDDEMAYGVEDDE